MSVVVTHDTDPDMFTYADTNSYWGLDIAKMNLTDNIYHASYIVKYTGGHTNMDVFTKILSMSTGTADGTIANIYTKCVFIEGRFSHIERKEVYGRCNFEYYDYLKTEK
jgi:hypothetical protein